MIQRLPEVFSCLLIVLFALPLPALADGLAAELGMDESRWSLTDGLRQTMLVRIVIPLQDQEQAIGIFPVCAAGRTCRPRPGR